MRSIFQRPPASAALLGLLCCSLICIVSGCSRFQKEDVEKEFNNFVALHQEVNIYAEIVLTLEKNNIIDGDASAFFVNKIYSTKLHLESILDIIFFYRHSDFGNYDNYILVLEYVNTRLDSLTSALAAQRETIEKAAPNLDNPTYQRFIQDYSEYLHRIIAQVAILKAKAK